MAMAWLWDGVSSPCRSARRAVWPVAEAAGERDRRELFSLIRSGRVHYAASGHCERHVACPHPTAGTLSAAT